jgi:hypothetical protein
MRRVVDTIVELDEDLTPWAAHMLPRVVSGVLIDGRFLTRPDGWDEPAQRRLAGLIASSKEGM